jgi:hypothetical protein
LIATETDPTRLAIFNALLAAEKEKITRDLMDEDEPSHGLT